MTKSETRKKVLEAFRTMRRHNIIARANFMCCQTCAGYDLAQMAKKRNARGWVFWHHQDEESFWRTAKLFIAYAGADEDKFSTIEVGELLKDVLANHGLTVEWSGCGTDRIMVIDKDKNI